MLISFTFVLKKMATFLFDKIIFGPVRSRRLGISLGINLLPLENKFCNFDCIYCECGRTFKGKLNASSFHGREEVRKALVKKLSEMKAENNPPDVITFAGNGEPTIHKDFSEIIDDTILSRDEIFPQARIAVLSNATMIGNKKVFDALLKIDDNILKLDSAIPETVNLIDNPPKGYSIRKIVENMKKFEGKFILQTMFLSGEYSGKSVNNSTDREVNAWIDIIKEIKPEKIMIYTIARDTPSPGLQKISMEKLNEIAEKVKTETGISVSVSG